LKTGELVIYVDESGSPDVFSSTHEDLLAMGRTPNYLVIAALRCPHPNMVARSIASSIAWANALPNRTRPTGRVSYLHATRDDDRVREHVCRELAQLPVKATGIVMDKRLLDPARTWRNDRRAFYNEMAARLLCDSLHLYECTRIIFSRKNYETRADLKLMTATLQMEWSRFMTNAASPVPKLVTARQESMAKNPGLQAVDYVAWALFRVFESRDMTYYQMLQPIVRHVQDLGRLTHYTARDPIRNPP